MTKNVFEKCKHHCKNDGYKVKLITTYPKYRNHIQYSAGRYYRPNKVMWHHDSITICYEERRLYNSVIERIPKEIILTYNEIDFIYMLNSEGNDAYTRAKG